MTLTPSVLDAAISGLQAQQQAISAQLQELLTMRDGKGHTSNNRRRPQQKPLSKEARERIAEATRKRWRKYHAEKKAAAAKRARPKKAAKAVAKKKRAKVVAAAAGA